MAKGYICFYCGVQLVKSGHNVPNRLTKDHVIPRSSGGTSCVGNLVRACRRCNSWKGSLSLEEFLKVLPVLLKTHREMNKKQIKIVRRYALNYYDYPGTNRAEKLSKDKQYAAAHTGWTHHLASVLERGLSPNESQRGYDGDQTNGAAT